MIDGRIADDDYQKKHRKLKAEQTEITNKLRTYDTADGKFANHLEYLVKVASGAADYFTGSKISQKRDIIKYVFSNLQLRGKNLEYTMTYPFCEFAKYRQNGEWCTLLDVIRTGGDIKLLVLSMPYPYSLAA